MMGAPRPNPLQRLWLREIGIEKTWLSQPDEPRLGAAEPGGPPEEPPGAPALPRGAAHEAAATQPRGEDVSSSQGQVRPFAAPGQAAAGESRERRPAPPPVSVPRPRAPAPGPGRTVEPAAAKAADGAPQMDNAERLAGIARADFGTLRTMVQECKACGLCSGRRNAVFGMGPEAGAARWMVVGEAPGAEEDRQGLPFVGRSGQLLDAMLDAVGMSRARDVFIGNVIKCRPPGNRNPTPEEVAACSPYLMRQIELVQPERILVLGRFAAQTLLGTDATIGSLRGRVHSVEVAGRRIPAVVSYHPAYLLRSPPEKARSWQDLRLAAKS